MLLWLAQAGDSSLPYSEYRYNVNTNHRDSKRTLFVMKGFQKKWLFFMIFAIKRRPPLMALFSSHLHNVKLKLGVKRVLAVRE